MANLSAAGGRERPAGGFELGAWLFMRVSGVLLVLLALGHLAIMHLINSVDTIDFDFVVKRMQSPGWRMYDWLLLTLALFHGMNGLRYVIDDYLRPSGWRVFLKVMMYLVTLMCFVTGTYVVLAWNPGG